MSRSTWPGTGRRTRAGTVAVGVVAVGAVTVTVAPWLSSITGAADPTVTPIVVEDSLETHPIVSDDGSLVLLTSTLPPEDPPAGDVDSDEPATLVRLHDLTATTTTDLPDANARFAALSGDGCTIAYGVPIAQDGQPAGGAAGDDGSGGQGTGTDDAEPSDDVDGTQPGAAAPAPGDDPDVAQLPAAPPEFEVRVVDRCSDVSTSVAVAVTPLVAPLALDRRGLTLVANTGAHVVRFTRPAGSDIAFVETDRFDLDPVATDDSITSGPVDVSDDGSVIAFAAAPAPSDDVSDPPPPGVHVWADGEITPIADNATAPSLSGDGELVVFDVEAAPLDAGPDGITLVERPGDTGQSRRVLIDADGDLPRLSADGTHILYVVADGTAPGLRRASWVGDGTRPFDSFVVADLGLPIEGEERLGVPETAPSTSRHGGVMASDDLALGDVLIRTAPVVASFDADRYDLGAGVVGTTLRGTATLTNGGSSTIDLDDATIAIGSPFTIVAADAGTAGACVGLLRPATTCTVDVEYVVAAAIDTVADLTFTVADAETPLATTTVVAVGTPETTTTTSSTTTTTTQAPVVTTPSTTPNTTRPRPGIPSRPTTRPPTRVTTTTTTTIPTPPAFSPSTFEFAPTIVGAGRRVASLSIGNPSTTSVEVVDVTVEPPDAGFTIDDGSTCAGSTLGSGASCRVDVAFAPTTEGPVTVTLVASLSDGTTVRATVSGFGAPVPVVSVVPGVATTGQVVTIRGSGFPAGAAIDVDVASEAVPHAIVVSDVGSFDVPIVILPNTLPGPLVVSVPGQADLFPTVESSLLVTATNDRTAPSVLRGIGPNVGR